MDHAQSSSSAWQAALNPSLVERLNRPRLQPGTINNRCSSSILKRARSLTQRLPMLVSPLQRWGGAAGSTSPGVPIVHARPLSPHADNFSATRSQSPLAVSMVSVQRKPLTAAVSMPTEQMQASASSALQGAPLNRSESARSGLSLQAPSILSQPSAKKLLQRSLERPSMALAVANGQVEEIPFVIPSAAAGINRLPSFVHKADSQSTPSTALPVVECKPVIVKALDQKLSSPGVSRRDSAGTLPDASAPAHHPSRPVVKAKSPVHRLSISATTPVIARSPLRPGVREQVTSTAPLTAPASPNRALVLCKHPELPLQPGNSGETSGIMPFARRAVAMSSVSAAPAHGVIQRQLAPAISAASASQPAAALPSLPSVSAAQPAARAPDVTTLTEQVYQRLLRRWALERERRGG